MSIHIEVPRPRTPEKSRSPSPNYSGTLYFGYGSNLWQYQMVRRCPSVKYIGIARLRHWRWQINDRGYANVVEAPAAPYSPATTRWLGPLMGTDDLRDDNDRAYGMVYQLNTEDEETMDKYEDVPESYTKEWTWVELWERKDKEGKLDVLKKPKRVRVMLYADKKYTSDDKNACSGLYTYKINQGIMDALDEGIPQSYINNCIRPFVPVVDNTKLVTLAVEDAIKMGIDVKKLVERAEVQLAETGAKQEREATAVSQQSLVEYLRGIMAQEDKGKEYKTVSRRRALTSNW